MEDVAPAPQIFEPCASVQQRFPGKQGVELLEAIFELYSINRSAHLTFFDPKGQPMIKPHEINMRRQSQVLRKYVSELNKKNYLFVGAISYFSVIFNT